MVRVGINGFGRIGRCTLKQMLAREEFEVVGINDLADLGDLAYLLEHDSIHGRWRERIRGGDGRLQIADRSIPFFSSSNPAEVPWRDLGADVVIESSGALRTREKAGGHIDGGARKVIISAPSEDADAMFVPGVNLDTYDPKKHHVVSLASCTTNCLAPVLHVLHSAFGIEHATFVTVHAYTASQTLMDKPTRKRRRGRAAALSIIPTTTGASTATERVLPELHGRLQGSAMRVPVANGSVLDLTATVNQDVTAERVNDAFKRAASEDRFRGILEYSEEDLVSADIIGDTHSSVLDSKSTVVLRDRVVKVLSWYDNEWGYSARLVDGAAYIASKGF